MKNKEKFSLEVACLLMCIFVCQFTFLGCANNRDVEIVSKLEDVPSSLDIFRDLSFHVDGDIDFYSDSDFVYIKFKTNEESFDKLVDIHSLNNSAITANFQSRKKSSLHNVVKDSFIPKGISVRLFEESPYLRSTRSKSTFYLDCETSILYIHWSLY